MTFVGINVNNFAIFDKEQLCTCMIHTRDKIKLQDVKNWSDSRTRMHSYTQTHKPVTLFVCVWNAEIREGHFIIVNSIELK